MAVARNVDWEAVTSAWSVDSRCAWPVDELPVLDVVVGGTNDFVCSAGVSTTEESFFELPTLCSNRCICALCFLGSTFFFLSCLPFFLPSVGPVGLLTAPAAATDFPLAAASVGGALLASILEPPPEVSPAAAMTLHCVFPTSIPAVLSDSLM